MKTPQFQRRHYNFLATTMAELYLAGKVDCEAVNAFAKQLQATNEHFCEARFLEYVKDEVNNV